MSDQHPDPVVPQPTADPEQPSRGSRWSRWRRWRTGAPERAGRVRRGVALAVAAALLLGGAGGFAIGAFAADGGPGHRHDGRPGQGEPYGHRPDGGPGDRQAPPPGLPGQLPPATSEDEQDLQG